MLIYQSPEDYLYNLQAMTGGEAKRMWRQSVKDKWNNKCAYCESTENLTLDHIIPQCKGGTDHITNVVCCCKSCNNSKAHADWEIWYYNQDFFTEERMDAIIDWRTQLEKQELKVYKPRKIN